MKQEEQLFETLDALMQGDFTPLSDPWAPPWVETGVISQVDREYFESHTSLADVTIEISRLPRAYLLKDVGRAELLFEEDGIRCSRGLTEQDVSHLEHALRDRTLSLD